MITIGDILANVFKHKKILIDQQDNMKEKSNPLSQTVLNNFSKEFSEDL